VGEMDAVDTLVVGAGVIGLAVAQRLAERKQELVVVEQHDGFGRETSSRNSEVIHCGMYYAEDLLKTRLCVRGNPLLYELCERRGIPYRRTGKIVAATDSAESIALEKILAQGRKNGVPGLRLASGTEVGDLEPHVRCVLGLCSDTSGIVSSHALMEYFQQSAASNGATIAYNCRVAGIRRDPEGYTVEIDDADGARVTLRAHRVVNSAGLQADRIAEMVGIDPETAGYAIRPCKGEYFRVSARHGGKLRRLVYPVPSAVHLGAHAVLGLDGSLKIGPSSFYVSTLDYSVDPGHGTEFLEKARRFLPFLEEKDLAPDMSGIRPKLSRRGEPFRDWVIREERDRGLPGFVNLIGMESPGLTSCLAIAEMVDGLLPS
jgi:L-2-hydroxyglutarate oxidase LhgO